jgi:hypothetical protein
VRSIHKFIKRRRVLGTSSGEMFPDYGELVAVGADQLDDVGLVT